MSHLLPMVEAGRLVRREGGETWAPRPLAEEVPVAMSYGGTTHAVMMASPADLEDFALGFCLSERIIAAASGLKALEIVQAEGGIDLQMTLSGNDSAALSGRRRALAGPVGCGLCGIESIAEALRPLGSIGDTRLSVTPHDIRKAFERLPHMQALNAATGAAHAAGFYVPGNGLVLVREDVGRHNALDKLIGALARHGTDIASGMIMLTSRVSVEMIQKAAIAGCSVVAAVSAPTALAVSLAQAANITLVALVRGSDHEVFTHAGRIRSNNGNTAHVA